MQVTNSLVCGILNDFINIQPNDTLYTVQNSHGDQRLVTERQLPADVIGKLHQKEHVQSDTLIVSKATAHEISSLFFALFAHYVNNLVWRHPAFENIESLLQQQCPSHPETAKTRTIIQRSLAQTPLLNLPNELLSHIIRVDSSPETFLKLRAACRSLRERLPVDSLIESSQLSEKKVDFLCDGIDKKIVQVKMATAKEIAEKLLSVASSSFQARIWRYFSPPSESHKITSLIPQIPSLHLKEVAFSFSSKSNAAITDHYVALFRTLAPACQSTTSCTIQLNRHPVNISLDRRARDFLSQLGELTSLQKLSIIPVQLSTWPPASRQRHDFLREVFKTVAKLPLLTDLELPLIREDQSNPTLFSFIDKLPHLTNLTLHAGIYVEPTKFQGWHSFVEQSIPPSDAKLPELKMELSDRRSATFKLKVIRQ